MTPFLKFTKHFADYFKKKTNFNRMFISGNAFPVENPAKFFVVIYQDCRIYLDEYPDQEKLRNEFFYAVHCRRCEIAGLIGQPYLSEGPTPTSIKDYIAHVNPKALEKFTREVD